MKMKMKGGVHKVLVKTDKHGNKTFRTNACKRCGGYGRVYRFGDAAKDICWKCRGTGTEPEYKTVEYTPEQAQLRRDKATAKKLGTVADQLRRMGFNADGFGWRPRGNSFAVRDRLKALGGTWNGSTWTVPVEPDFIESDRVAASDCTVIEERGELLKFEYVRWRWC